MGLARHIWPAPALLLGAACTARELQRYENPPRLDPLRLLYFLFWTFPAPFNILPYKPLACLVTSLM
jgi:hypothetical protein